MNSVVIAISTPAAEPLSTAHRVMTTPRRLAAAGTAVALLVAGLGLLVGATVTGVGGGFTVIGQQAAPQVRVSSDLYFALSDLDAQAANVLLVGTDPTLAGSRTAALNLYEQRRVQADHDLDRAAQDAGGDAATQRIISTAIDQLGHYESLVTQAVLINKQGHDPVGRPSEAALAMYRQATDSMRGTLSAVGQLISRNSGVLDSAYADGHGKATGAGVWFGLLGGVVVVALVGLQVLLRLWSRRKVNPALLLATALALALTAGGIGVLSSAAGRLTVAKQDAFDSIIALSQARSVSYDANADESRYLVDPLRATQYQQAFQTKSQSLVDLNTADLHQYDSALASALTAYHANNADVRFTGYYGTEMRNITFTGERAAAEQVLATYQAYQLDDRHVRSLASTGDLAGAVRFDTGTAQGQSDYAFTQYDNALMRVIQINQNAFDTAVHDGQSGLSGWNLLIPGLGVLLIVGLVTGGLWPRIAEYR